MPLDMHYIVDFTEFTLTIISYFINLQRKYQILTVIPRLLILQRVIDERGRVLNSTEWRASGVRER